MLIRNSKIRVALQVSLLCVLGCADDATNETTAPTTVQTGTAGTASAGASGGATPINQPVACGASTCEVPAEAKGLVKACCADEATSTCGLSSSFVKNECKPPAAEHPTCPGLTIAGTMAVGCCTPMGKCGIDVSIIGMGCIDGSRLGGMSTMIGGMTIEAPPPMDCTAEGGAAPADPARMTTTDEDAGAPASP